MKILTSLTKFTSILLFVFASALVSCNDNAGTGDGTDADTTNNTDANSTNNQTQAGAMLAGTFTDTSLNGTATFNRQSDGKVKMNLQITVPSKANQSVAVHIHEHGNCGDTATHAGGHWNPTGVNHGKWGEGSFHSGDIGNITLDAEGRGSIDIETDLWTIGGDARTNILDKTIIVHGGVDDFTSQPSGNSGTRIGCGIIKGTGESTAGAHPTGH